MTRRFLIRKHPAVITATEIQIIGSQGVMEPVLRFQSLAELLDHFALQGASQAALDSARSDFNATGMAGLVFYQDRKK